VQHRPPDMVCEVFRFCTIAARWNSSRAPEEAAQAHALEAMVGLQVAKRISTFLRSSARFIELGK